MRSRQSTLLCRCTPYATAHRGGVAGFALLCIGSFTFCTFGPGKKPYRSMKAPDSLHPGHFRIGLQVLPARFYHTCAEKTPETV